VGDKASHEGRVFVPFCFWFRLAVAVDDICLGGWILLLVAVDSVGEKVYITPSLMGLDRVNSNLCNSSYHLLNFAKSIKLPLK
jgi:hypothetical protein